MSVASRILNWKSGQSVSLPSLSFFSFPSPSLPSLFLPSRSLLFPHLPLPFPFLPFHPFPSPSFPPLHESKENFQCLSNASQHVHTYLQPFTSYSKILVGNCNFFLPPLAFNAPYGVAYGTIAVNVTWIEIEFNGC